MRGLDMPDAATLGRGGAAKRKRTMARIMFGPDSRVLGALLAALLLAAAVFAAAPAPAGHGDPVISAEDAFQDARSGTMTVVDVRSPQEWRQTGVAPGAKKVTIHNPAGFDGFLAEMLDAVEGDKARPIALICAGGVRSSRAYQFLKSRGFTNLHNVLEGMMGRGADPGWLKRGLPVEPCDC